MSVVRRVKELKCPNCGEVSRTSGRFRLPSFTVVKADLHNPKDSDIFMCDCCGALSTRKQIIDYNG